MRGYAEFEEGKDESYSKNRDETTSGSQSEEQVGLRSGTNILSSSDEDEDSIRSPPQQTQPPVSV